MNKLIIIAGLAFLAGITLPLPAQEGQTVVILNETTLENPDGDTVTLRAGSYGVDTGRRSNGMIEVRTGNWVAWWSQDEIRPLRLHAPFRDKRVEQAYIDAQGDDAEFRARCEAIRKEDEEKRRWEELQRQLDELRRQQEQQKRRGR